jgi:ABC-2 type transport system permease protein
MFVIALREYNAAVRTKTFLISLLIIPVMMGGSLLIQWLLKDVKDIKDKHFAIINRTDHPDLFGKIQATIDLYNQTQTVDQAGKQFKPHFVLAEVPPPGEGEINALRAKLSDRVREGELFGFVEVGPKVFTPKPAPPPGAPTKDHYGAEYGLRYQSNRPTYFEFPQVVSEAINQIVQAERGLEAKVKKEVVRDIVTRVPMESKGLSKARADGTVEDASDIGQMAPFVVPFGLLMMMFMVIMMSATPLMQGVVEEKMQRIAEVLLGSVRPFELMMGKLLGMSAVSMTITAVYLGGAYWAAHRFEFTEYLGGELMLWFLVFQALAALMYGSLFIAIGAACTDMKETQNLLWPVMLLACLPMFLIGSVLQEPNSPVPTAVSFFPFSSPMLMVARMAVPPGIPAWQPLLAVLGALVTTVLCVYAAGRIFRVGLLMQGKGAKLGEMIQWVIRG